MAEAHIEAPFWSCPPQELLERLNTAEHGLEADAAAARLREVGPNTLQTRQRRALLLEFLARFLNPLVLVLLAASAISAVLGELTSFAIILVIILFSVALDFVQEYRAGNAAERLRRSVALKATTLRNGQRTELPAEELVPGDVITLAAGDLVPADARILQARDFFVD